LDSLLEAEVRAASAVADSHLMSRREKEAEAEEEVEEAETTETTETAAANPVAKAVFERVSRPQP
jgi:hypothetical protein